MCMIWVRWRWVATAKEKSTAADRPLVSIHPSIHPPLTDPLTNHATKASHLQVLKEAINQTPLTCMIHKSNQTYLHPGRRPKTKPSTRTQD